MRNEAAKGMRSGKEDDVKWEIVRETVKESMK